MKRKAETNFSKETTSFQSKRSHRESREICDTSEENELHVSVSVSRNNPKYDYFEILASKGFEDVANVLQDEGVSWDVLNRVTEGQLERLGIRQLGRRLEAIKVIEEITWTPSNYMAVNDPIHGYIDIPPLCVKIIDTPQFQRLRFLKQLGGAYFVYPGAAHNRFEHSLGVCHLAGKLASSLRRHQPELGITDTDILCVQIAGLCHDLGHGPYSHAFEKKFLPLARPDKKFQHEDLSVKMLLHLIKKNKLVSEFNKSGLTVQDMDFIKELIAGPLKREAKEWPYKGRGHEKGFLYEIVANRRNGIDVDKWDYFARDCHMLGFKNSFDHGRCMKYARVLKADGGFRICLRDKEVGNLYDMFYTRKSLHRRAYQHIVGNIIDIMITEAMLKSDEIMKIPGEKGEMKRISETVDDMEAYQKLTDDIFQQILWSTDSRLKESLKILKRILKRKLYKLVGQTHSPEGKTINSESEEDKIKDQFCEVLREDNSDLKKDDIVIHIVNLNYGMNEKNPIDFVWFYRKNNPTKPIRLKQSEVVDLLPEKFSDQWIRFYCKKRDDLSIMQATDAFNNWRKLHGCCE